MKELDGKVAVITGGSRGFGFAVARAYLLAGAQVVLSSRSSASAQGAVARLGAVDGQAIGVVSDVRQLEQVQELAAQAISAFGRIDVWVNNAGVSAPYGQTMQIMPETIIEVLQTNIFGVYHGSLVAMQHFLERGQGKLINILGRGDRQPVPLQNAYASSKAWIRNFTLALAKEHRSSGIGVYAFNPGMMLTDLLQEVEVVAGYEERVKPLNTILRMWAKDPEIPARRAVWLASAATDGRTGLEVRELTPGWMLAGAFKEGLRLLTRSRPQLGEVQVRTVPVYSPYERQNQGGPRERS